MHTAEKGEDRCLGRAIAKRAAKRSGSPAKSPEQEPKPQPRVPTSVQTKRIWRDVVITFLVLILGAYFTIAAREIFLGEPVLERPPVDETSRFLNILV